MWFHIREYHPLCLTFPDCSIIRSYSMLRSYNPTSKLVVCPLTRSLAATSVISIDFSSCGYLDVSVPRVGSINGNTYRYVLGCPIQKFPDQSPLTAPRDLSQPGTSFIASTSQGIHRSLLVAYLLYIFYFADRQSRPLRWGASLPQPT